ncbi:MAG: GIY-YIG nuclease family protein [Ignavibacteriales bacterium]|nr:GIY-YIG nuclease family protein [Ignavibacteriales bacterium]
MREAINSLKHFVYIIQSEKDKSYYVGYSHNPQLRLEHHNMGWSRSTKGKMPWRLMYIEECKDKTEALKREREIKNRKSRKYIEELIAAGGRPVQH